MRRGSSTGLGQSINFLPHVLNIGVRTYAAGSSGAPLVDNKNNVYYVENAGVIVADYNGVPLYLLRIPGGQVPAVAVLVSDVEMAVASSVPSIDA